MMSGRTSLVDGQGKKINLLLNEFRLNYLTKYIFCMHKNLFVILLILVLSYSYGVDAISKKPISFVQIL